MRFTISYIKQDCRNYLYWGIYVTGCSRIGNLALFRVITFLISKCDFYNFAFSDNLFAAVNTITYFKANSDIIFFSDKMENVLFFVIQNQ